MKKCIVVSVCFIIFILHARGQDSISVNNIQNQDSITIITDSTFANLSEKDLTVDVPEAAVKEAFKPNPTRAVIYSAIFPGLGQIYNRKYWKLPIIYGGFLGLSYGFSWNGRYYDDYSKGYRALMSDNPTSQENFNNWVGLVPSYQNREPSSIPESDIERFRSAFRRKRDFYRRNRDLCIIGAVGVYLICMVDAYVDAQLFDFDISPDLSLKVQPAVMSSGTSFTSLTKDQALGVQCSLKF